MKTCIEPPRGRKGRRTAPVLLLAAIVLASAGRFPSAPPAYALEDQKLIAVITRISIAPDEKSARTTVKSTRGNKEVVLHVTNELVIDKFKSRKLDVGDEVRAKYEVRDGQNYCTYLRKAAGE